MIKNFIYLDEQKMYSLSSQIFEGITAFVLNESGNEGKDSESQKGPVGSGRTLANVIKSSSKSTEKNFSMITHCHFLNVTLWTRERY